jgi:hypothetical protein
MLLLSRIELKLSKHLMKCAQDYFDGDKKMARKQVSFTINALLDDGSAGTYADGPFVDDLFRRWDTLAVLAQNN